MFYRRTGRPLPPKSNVDNDQRFVDDGFFVTPADPTLRPRGEGVRLVEPNNLKQLSFLGGGSFLKNIFRHLGCSLLIAPSD